MVVSKKGVTELCGIIRIKSPFKYRRIIIRHLNPITINFVMIKVKPMTSRPFPAPQIFKGIKFSQYAKYRHRIIFNRRQVAVIFFTPAALQDLLEIRGKFNVLDKTFFRVVSITEISQTPFLGVHFIKGKIF